MSTAVTWIFRQGFLISLAVVFAAGFWAADWFRPLTDQVWLRNTIVLIVMWTSGMTLPLRSVQSSVRRPGAVMAAVVINIVLVPIVAWWVAAWIAPQWRLGLYVAALVPCTLASAMVWTRRAGGDDSIALLTTVVTNLACVAVIPLGWWLVHETTAVLPGQSTLTEQAIKLATLVVVPLVVAQIMRGCGMSDWAERSKSMLSRLAQAGILMMVLFGAVASSDRVGSVNELGGRFGIFQLLLAASLIHLFCLGFGIAVTRWGLRRGPETQIAVGISSSQKTLMVGLQTALDLGVSVLPMIVYHLIQLVWDTVLADAWKRSHSGQD